MQEFIGVKLFYAFVLNRREYKENAENINVLGEFVKN